QVEVVAFPLVDRMGANPHVDVEIARWSPLPAGAALSRQPDHAPVGNPGRDLHLQAGGGGDDAAPVATRAGGTGLLAAAVAGGADAAEGHVPLGGAHPAGAAAGGAGRRMGIVPPAAPAAGAGGRPLHLDEAARAPDHFTEVDLEGGAEIRAGLGAGVR